MIRIYTSKYGKLVKACPGLHEYYFHGKFVARGSSLSDPNPACKPTKEDWEFCRSLVKEADND